MRKYIGIPEAKNEVNIGLGGDLLQVERGDLLAAKYCIANYNLGFEFFVNVRIAWGKRGVNVIQS